MPTIKVHVWQDSYYPGGYQTRPASDRITNQIVNTVEQNGGEVDRKRTAVFDSLDEFPIDLTPRQRREIEGGGCTLMIDAWTYAHLYGYDAHTAFEAKKVSSLSGLPLPRPQ